MICRMLIAYHFEREEIYLKDRIFFQKHFVVVILSVQLDFVLSVLFMTFEFMITGQRNNNL